MAKLEQLAEVGSLVKRGKVAMLSGGEQSEVEVGPTREETLQELVATHEAELAQLTQRHQQRSSAQNATTARCVPTHEVHHSTRTRSTSR